jgi:hypothetical protein
VRACKRCGGDIADNRRTTAVYCSDLCRKRSKISVTVYPGVTTGTAGAISELRAACDLMRSGYPTFRALSPSCPCDLIVLTMLGPVRIEVRTQCVGVKSTYLKSSKDKGRQDVFAFVGDTEITYDPALPPPPTGAS